MGAVHPVVKETTLEVIRRAYAEGIYVQISMGLRTMEQQAKLFGEGRSNYIYKGKQYGNPSKPRVTNALPGQSLHNYGLAVDYFLVSADGNNALWTINAKWKRVGAIGKSLGFTWGGDWTIARDGIVDFPHFQMTGGLILGQLQAGKKPNLKFKGKPTVGNSSVEVSSVKIKKLQEDLLKLGYKLPKYGADGYPGRETDNAVKQLQKDAGIKVDGIVGESTLKAIDELLKGGLTMKQYEELKKVIDGQAKEIAALKKGKQDKPLAGNTPDPTHAENWKKATAAGVVNGERPHEPLTREQFATIYVESIEKE